MHALCQINVLELPFRPAGLEDVELVAVFIGAGELPIDTPNGVGWCLRAYDNIGALVPLEPTPSESAVRAFPMRSELVEEDFPCWEDVAIDLPSTIDEQYGDLFTNTEGVKLGGWPTLVQGEIQWAPFTNHDTEPQYVFQVDSVEKANWQWGDNGVGYFGRASSPGASQEWFLTWQCY
jgi:hypothetical protein